MELLTHTGGLSESLRVPAVSRLQKLHNVSLVIKRIHDANIGDGKAHMVLLIVIHSSSSLIWMFLLISLIFLQHFNSIPSWRSHVSMTEKYSIMYTLYLCIFYIATADCNQEAKNIVDGNRDRTLFLLWQILYGFELKMVCTREFLSF